MSGPLMIAARNAASGGAAPFSIANSLRFDGTNDYLSRTFGTPTDNNLFTYSGWIKRGALGSTQALLAVYIDAANYTAFNINSVDKLDFVHVNGTTTYAAATSASVYRDPSAWMHILLIADRAQGTDSNRIKMYVNGVPITAWTTTPTWNDAQNVYMNQNRVHTISQFSTIYLGGYLSDIYFIDGQALTPSDFGELNAENVWVPKAYSGTYGNNGFHLDFSDGTSTTTLGYDAAGSNDWTLNGMTRAAGTSECWMVDTPTDNFAVLNPIDPDNSFISGTPSNGALTWIGGAIAGGRLSSIAMVSGVYAAEIKATGVGAGAMVGVYEAGADAFEDNGTYWRPDGRCYINNSSYVSNASYATGAVLGLEFDADTKIVTFYKDGTAQANTQTLSGSGPWCFMVGKDTTSGTTTWDINFGARGDFDYTYGTALALSTANLPAVAIPNPAEHFDVALDTGANIKTTMDALFSGNVFEWIKDRANSNNHQLADVNRGLTAILQSNTTAAETTYSAPSGSSVGWGWKANGAGVSNTDGSITSAVSANTTAGFSIVTYTGTGANATVGHGLGVAPKLVIVKNRGSISSWSVYHASNAATGTLYLESTSAFAAGTTDWNSTTPTSTTISIGANMRTNESGKEIVAYCFAEIPGYSKFGSYTGNGSTDGQFVYCGFRPRYVMVKCSSTAGNWENIDTARDDYNVADAELIANSSAAEATLTMLDVTSNGFKLRTTDADFNGANTYIFAAFAEHPSGGSNVSPATAR